MGHGVLDVVLSEVLDVRNLAFFELMLHLLVIPSLLHFHIHSKDSKSCLFCLQSHNLILTKSIICHWNISSLKWLLNYVYLLINVTISCCMASSALYHVNRLEGFKYHVCAIQFYSSYHVYLAHGHQNVTRLMLHDHTPGIYLISNLENLKFIYDDR